MPEGIWLRLGLGLLVGTALVVGLNLWVTGKERSRLSQAALKPAPRPPAELPGSQALASLQGEARSFCLARRLQDLPTGCAPVLRITASGALQIPVAAPLPAAPGPARWPRLGILLPTAEVAALAPEPRSMLLQIWSRLGPAKGLEPEDLQLYGCRIQPDQLRRMLRWLR